MEKCLMRSGEDVGLSLSPLGSGFISSYARFIHFFIVASECNACLNRGEGRAHRNIGSRIFPVAGVEQTSTWIVGVDWRMAQAPCQQADVALRADKIYI